MGFKLITSEVIGTDCTGSCKSNYHMIKTAVDPIEECFTCVIINMDKVWLTFRAGLSYSNLGHLKLGEGGGGPQTMQMALKYIMSK